MNFFWNQLQTKELFVFIFIIKKFNNWNSGRTDKV